MADSSQEPKHVNVEDPSAAAYWARRFQVPVEDVMRAVREVGDESLSVDLSHGGSAGSCRSAHRSR